MGADLMDHPHQQQHRRRRPVQDCEHASRLSK